MVVYISGPNNVTACDPVPTSCWWHASVPSLCLQLDLGVKPPRSWHIACTHYPSIGRTEVFLFGGNVHIKPDEQERVDAADLRILTWGGCAPIGGGGWRDGKDWIH